MIFRDRRNGNYWQSDSCPSAPPFDSNPETFAVFPLGGGFLHNIPRSELEEVEFPNEQVFGWATFDDDPDVYACIYNPHARWNGWHQPRFTKQVADKIIEKWQSYLTVEEENMVITFMGEDRGDRLDYYLLTQNGKDPDEDQSISVYHNKATDLWMFDAVCWICMDDEALANFGARWDISHIKHQ
jgi:hypothetical protein